MINVTENAVRQLRSLLQKAANTEKGLRVQIAKGGCSGLQYEMALDEKSRAMPWSNAMASNFSSIMKAPLTCAMRLSIFMTA